MIMDKDYIRQNRFAYIEWIGVYEDLPMWIETRNHPRRTGA